MIRPAIKWFADRAFSPFDVIVMATFTRLMDADHAGYAVAIIFAWPFASALLKSLSSDEASQ
jgi:hypothetical protein